MQETYLRVCEDDTLKFADPLQFFGYAARAMRSIMLGAALQRLERDDLRAARLVELHCFAGLSLPRIAEILGVKTRTLDRDWRFARAYLTGALG